MDTVPRGCTLFCWSCIEQGRGTIRPCGWTVLQVLGLSCTLAYLIIHLSLFIYFILAVACFLLIPHVWGCRLWMKALIHSSGLWQQRHMLYRLNCEKSVTESARGKYAWCRKICRLSSDAKCSRVSYMWWKLILLLPMFVFMVLPCDSCMLHLCHSESCRYIHRMQRMCGL